MLHRATVRVVGAASATTGDTVHVCDAWEMPSKTSHEGRTWVRNAVAAVGDTSSLQTQHNNTLEATDRDAA